MQVLLLHAETSKPSWINENIRLSKWREVLLNVTTPFLYIAFSLTVIKIVQMFTIWKCLLFIDIHIFSAYANPINSSIWDFLLGHDNDNQNASLLPMNANGIPHF